MWIRVAIAVQVVLALAGLSMSNALRLRTYRPDAMAPWAARVCAAGDGLACDRVLQSRYAAFGLPWLGRHPSALWGMMYFALLGTWYLAVGRPTHPARRWHLIPLGIHLLGSLLGVYLTYIMVTELRAVCPLCMVTHVASWLMLLLGLALWPRRPRPIAKSKGDDERAPPPRAMPDLRTGLLAIALCLSAAWLLKTFHERDYAVSQALQYRSAWQTRQADVEYLRLQFARQSARPIPVGEDDPVRGPAEAAHTIVVFSDFQCPRCRDVAIFLRRQVEAEDRFDVRIAFKHFPLNPRCNPHAAANMHAFACAAAQAAEGARAIAGNDGFWKMHDQLFLNQNDLDLSPYRQLARTAGLDADQLEAAMHGEDATRRIARDAALAQLLGVNATPAVFLDGKWVDAWDQPAFWESVLTKAPARENAPQTRDAESTQ